MTNKDKLKDNLKKSFSAPQSSADKEKDLEALLNRTTKNKVVVAEPVEEDEPINIEKHRVTLDLSKQLARKVKTEAANRDQTLKAFIVDLLNRYFDEKERRG